MAVERIKDVVYADDPIQKFQGRWIGADGWEFPFHARYVSWGIFGVVFPLVLIGDRLLTGTVSPLPLVDLVISIGLTSLLANLTNGEVTLAHALVYLGRTMRAMVASRRGRPRPILVRDKVGRVSRRDARPASLAAAAPVGHRSDESDPCEWWPEPVYGPTPPSSHHSLQRPTPSQGNLR